MSLRSGFRTRAGSGPNSLSEEWGDDLWPTESQLVHFDYATPPVRARRTLVGVGDFREVRRDLRLLWTR